MTAPAPSDIAALVERLRLQPSDFNGPTRMGLLQDREDAASALEAQAAEIARLTTALSECSEQLSTVREALARRSDLPRGSDLLHTVIDCMAKVETISVEDLKARLKSSGAKATDKEIYNALGYLTRKGHIERFGYGRYRPADRLAARASAKGVDTKAS